MSKANDGMDARKFGIDAELERYKNQRLTEIALELASNPKAPVFVESPKLDWSLCKVGNIARFRNGDEKIIIEHQELKNIQDYICTISFDRLGYGFCYRRSGSVFGVPYDYDIIEFVAAKPDGSEPSQAYKNAVERYCAEMLIKVDAKPATKSTGVVKKTKRKKTWLYVVIDGDGDGIGIMSQKQAIKEYSERVQDDLYPPYRLYRLTPVRIKPKGNV